jgi:hypothetical protein
MAEQSPILTLDLPQGRRLTFATFDEIANWIGAEQQRLNWLVSASDLGPGNRLRDHYQNGFQILRTRLQEWRTQPSNPTGAQASQTRSRHSIPIV